MFWTQLRLSIPTKNSIKQTPPRNSVVKWGRQAKSRLGNMRTSTALKFLAFVGFLFVAGQSVMYAKQEGSFRRAENDVHQLLQYRAADEQEVKGHEESEDK